MRARLTKIAAEDRSFKRTIDVKVLYGDDCTIVLPRMAEVIDVFNDNFSTCLAYEHDPGVMGERTWRVRCFRFYDTVPDGYTYVGAVNVTGPSYISGYDSAGAPILGHQPATRVFVYMQEV